MRAMRWMGLGLAVAIAAPAAAFAQDAPAAPARPAMADRVKAMFDQVDADHDGYVTRDEANAARDAMQARMADRRKQMRDHAFARMDSNGDGSVSREEYDSAGPKPGGDKPQQAADGSQPPQRKPGMGRGRGAGMGGMFAMMFDRIDTDHDGRVSLAEAQAAVEQRMAMMRQHQPGGGPDDDGRPLGGGRN